MQSTGSALSEMIDRLPGGSPEQSRKLARRRSNERVTAEIRKHKERMEAAKLGSGIKTEFPRASTDNLYANFGTAQMQSL